MLGVDWDYYEARDILCVAMTFLQSIGKADGAIKRVCVYPYSLVEIPGLGWSYAIPVAVQDVLPHSSYVGIQTESSGLHFFPNECDCRKYIAQLPAKSP